MAIPIRRKDRLRKLLTDPEAFATSLLVVFADQYGTEGFGWTPATIRRELEQDFGVELPKLTFDRLLAAINVVTSDDFYRRLPIFIQLCNIFSGAEFNPYVFDPADAAECAWGMTEAMLLSPPAEDEPYADAVRYYLGAVLDAEGIKQAPDLLRLAIRDEPKFSGSDDPEMFQAQFETEIDQGQQILAMVRDNLLELFQQLETLPLQSGSAKDLAGRMKGNLKGV